MEPSTSTPSVIRSDALPKGAHVRLTPIRMISREPRHGTVVCGKRGTIRCIQMEGRDGYYSDTGDTYVDEIVEVLCPATGSWHPFVLTEKHAAAMAKIRAMGW